METKIYNTKVKVEVFGDIEYMYGVINGLARGLTQPVETLISEEYIPVMNSRDKHNDFIVTMHCTADRYETFTKVVETMYPDLCEFDCEVEY